MTTHSQTYTLTINGQSVEGDAGTFEIKNPATFETIGFAPKSSKAQVDAAVLAARKAQKSWGAQTHMQRKEYLSKVAAVLTEQTPYLAKWITQEQGKPMAGPGAMFEMQACVGWTQVNGGLDIPLDVVFEDDSRRDELHYKPLGVVAAIAPWNWPLMIAIWQIIPSLRMGNTVVIKPSEYTPIGTLEMVRLMAQVLPAGVLNTVCGDGSVGQQLVAHPDINKIMFTGSERTGRKVVEASSNNLARLTLELGGNDAAVLLDDIDPKAIAQDLFWGSFINMGQTCACAKRLYVPRRLQDEVVAALKEVIANTPMGNGLNDGVLMGPIQNKMQFDKVSGLIEDAKSLGATIEIGGKPMEGAGYFYPITLVTNIQDGARLVDEEQFGPVLPIIAYDDEATAIAKANSSSVGLGASVWSSDSKRAYAVANQLQAGTVWINQHGTIHPMVPFGGAKGSGYGLEFGIEGLKSVASPQVISIKK